VTLDHRYVDGFIIAEFARHFRAYFEHVEQFEPELASWPSAPAQEPSSPT
jgi:hypothetical protein